jgi:hypothetical protein
MKDYYSFAQKHKGESKFVDEYLNIMTKGLLIQENGINESRIAQRVEVFLWFTNRKNHFWGRSKIKSIPINEMENIEFTNKDGVYNFEMKIPSLVSDYNQDNINNVMFTIRVELPKKIDMANTSTYDENKVTWKVTRENLVEGFRLRAFTVK